MRQDELSPAPGSKKGRKRVGRGDLPQTEGGSCKTAVPSPRGGFGW